MAKHSSVRRPKSQTSLLSETKEQPNEEYNNSPSTSSAAHNSHIEQLPSSPTGTCRSARQAVDMARQDSGYESNTARSPLLHNHHTPRQRSTASTGGSMRGSHSRPAIRRSSKSGGPLIRPPTTAYNSSKPQAVAQTTSFPNLQALSYFAFPAPNLHPQETADRTPSPCMPPQTTYYWTSDGTRRREYKAIDKATQGFQGWARRNLVPSCFIPQDQRRTTFDDDTGSVRRYRIALESEGSEKSNSDYNQSGSKKKRWFH